MAQRELHKGRGASSNREGRFESRSREAFDDGWALDEEPPPALQTRVRPDPARSIISYNDSPDVGFDRSINPYRGCEHGCIYCYARPSHSYLSLSPGLDFESRLFFKANAAALLEAALRKPAYRPALISIGANTDAYQPIEREYRVTRALLDVLLRFRHPASFVTKSALVLRDLDLLSAMARERLIAVGVSLTSLDPALKRTLEPRAASGQARLRVIRELSAAGVPVTAMIAPVIPFVNDAEIERLLGAAREAGARFARYALLRLPHEVAPLFRDWLDQHHSLRAAHVMSLVAQARGGRDYDASWGQRFTGTGAYAELLGQRFRLAVQRLGFEQDPPNLFDFSRFAPPAVAGDQFTLF